MKPVRLAAALVVGALGSMLGAQTATETLRGRVVSDDTGEPIANVRVTSPSVALGSPVVLTDDDGRFTLTVGAGPGRIVASKPGYGRRDIARPAGVTTVDIRLQR